MVGSAALMRVSSVIFLISVQRHVKVAADEHFFACNLDIFNGHFVQIHFFLHSY